MFEQFETLDLFPVSLFDFLINLLVALVCGIIISLVYRNIYKGPNYSVTYVNSLVMLTLITSLVILVIGNNLARAFGLVGAMSIIRFRTAVRDVQDIVFIFFALAIGMAAGVGLHVIAFSGTLIISIVIIVLVTFNFANPYRVEHLLHVTYLAGPEPDALLKKILQTHTRRMKLINLKTLGEGQTEAYYQIVLKKNVSNGVLVADLQNKEWVKFVNLYFDEEDAGTL
ncbi:MAG: DUF4956 domain-containing protein [Bacteroidales bacterium]|nr:DUF4956 domain-containing protein [Bacteroidales bacterium]